jgi:tetratricopeptide (TPR) repeat protein
MAGSSENADRSVVPRWRTFREALASNELSSAEVAKAPRIDGTPFLRDKENQWLANRELPFAIDLVSAATVLGTSDGAKGAAEFVLEQGSRASPASQHLARNFLGIAEPEDIFENVTRLQIVHGLKSLKARRLSQPRNSFVWADLSRLYMLLGQNNQARQAMRVALGLSPTERFVIRSATRLLLHCKEREEALHLLRTNPRTATDPWLMAAEIAVSSIVGKTPKLARRGQELLKNSKAHPFHTSELACALGSLEMLGGNNRKANKLFTASLTKPTDNSLAQVVWASKRTGLGDINPSLLLLRHASEAKTLDAFNHADWIGAMTYANDWIRDEAFSARPHQLAASVAATFLDKFELAEQIAKGGLATNPRHPGLINNIAFALVSRGMPHAALKIMDEVDEDLMTPPSAICLVATAGLAFFRLGDPAKGKEHYELAIEAAARHNNNFLAVLARLYLARELVLQGAPGGLDAFQKAQDEARKLQNTNAPQIAEHLAGQVSDAELARKIRAGTAPLMLT